jgi:hypothetical protein
MSDHELAVEMSGLAERLGTRAAKPQPPRPATGRTTTPPTVQQTQTASTFADLQDLANVKRDLSRKTGPG